MQLSRTASSKAGQAVDKIKSQNISRGCRREMKVAKRWQMDVITAFTWTRYMSKVQGREKWQWLSYSISCLVSAAAPINTLLSMLPIIKVLYFQLICNIRQKFCVKKKRALISTIENILWQSFAKGIAAGILVKLLLL